MTKKQAFRFPFICLMTTMKKEDMHTFGWQLIPLRCNHITYKCITLTNHVHNHNLEKHSTQVRMQTLLRMFTHQKQYRWIGQLGLWITCEIFCRCNGGALYIRLASIKICSQMLHYQAGKIICKKILTFFIKTHWPLEIMVGILQTTFSNVCPLREKICLDSKLTKVGPKGPVAGDEALALGMV